MDAEVPPVAQSDNALAIEIKPLLLPMSRPKYDDDVWALTCSYIS